MKFENKFEYQFENNIGEQTVCDIYFNNLKTENFKPKPMILLIHGFRAFKDWGFFPYFAKKISEKGFFCSIIDFSLNKLIDKENCIFDMERFARNTVTQEISEINLFINNFPDFLEKNNLIQHWNEEICLIGHSLGGGLAIISAQNNPKTVKKLVTICSIFDFDIYTEKQKKNWLEKGIKEFQDPKTKQIIKLNVDFLLDRLTYSGEKSIVSTVAKLNIPYYILHTEADVTVPPKAAKILFNAVSNKNFEIHNKNFVKLEIIEKGNHLLGVSHPFVDSNPILERIINTVINFIEEKI